MATGVLNYRPDHVLDVEGLRRDGTRVKLGVALIAIPDETGRLAGITAIVREADLRSHRVRGWSPYTVQYCCCW